MKTKLVIAYTPEGGRPLQLVEVSDPHLLTEAARHAIAQKRSEADRLAGADCGLGLIAEREAERLQGILSALVPGLSEAV